MYVLVAACLLGLCGGEDGVGSKGREKAPDFWPSWISPFGANIAMIRLECDVPGQDAKSESHLPAHMVGMILKVGSKFALPL